VDVESWLKASRLRLNPGKTQVMWLGSQQLLSRLDIADVSVLLSRIPVLETARDLDVVIDSRLTLSDHVAAVCRSGYYQLRQLRPAVRCSSDDATHGQLAPHSQVVPPIAFLMTKLAHAK